ncbi:hypothetical protein B0J15DRAFT_459493 [Fusarium solani]|uniref:Uncharacterized protein n=1 Tax=Fusarium solani TaxID=169388 RepID=A0A9P9L574_FUSSL|nr:uncharacterized protein B0J15DRAFT_459493 [Fusarium solani]KAH7274454.1 hypothetical protein B0J15DRAFT_459493 [Fusarium solani]
MRVLMLLMLLMLMLMLMLHSCSSFLGNSTDTFLFPLQQHPPHRPSWKGILLVSRPSRPHSSSSSGLLHLCNAVDNIIAIFNHRRISTSPRPAFSSLTVCLTPDIHTPLLAQRPTRVFSPLLNQLTLAPVFALASISTTSPPPPACAISTNHPSSSVSLHPRRLSNASLPSTLSGTSSIEQHHHLQQQKLPFVGSASSSLSSCHCLSDSRDTARARNTRKPVQHQGSVSSLGSVFS